VVVPEEYLGDVIGDLSSRRGKVGGIESRGGTRLIHATVPLAEMFGYATDLRSATQGKAEYTMEFVRYDQVPAEVAEELKKKFKESAQVGG